MALKNFFLMNTSGKKLRCYVITLMENELRFLKYEDGVKTPVCSIVDVGSKLVYFVAEDDNFGFASIEYPPVVVRSPDGKPLPISQSNQLELNTSSGNMLIVRSSKYPDMPISTATVYFKKKEAEELSLLATVYLAENTLDLVIDFI
ncbi:MAG: hypothetical protein IJC37_02335 [Clostridia bacterium]|nr:hypothetical protein [Clostridia bacterium]MBQ4338240.1 hypothetical protein [Clostridia bacterium]